jgi:hypothetical protein
VPQPTTSHGCEQATAADCISCHRLPVLCTRPLSCDDGSSKTAIRPMACQSAFGLWDSFGSPLVDKASEKHHRSIVEARERVSRRQCGDYVLRGKVQGRIRKDIYRNRYSTPGLIEGCSHPSIGIHHRCGGRGPDVLTRGHYATAPDSSVVAQPFTKRSRCVCCSQALAPQNAVASRSVATTIACSRVAPIEARRDSAALSR